MMEFFDGIAVIIGIPIILFFSYVAGLLIRGVVFNETIGSGAKENIKTIVIGFIVIMIIGFILNRIGCSSDDSMYIRK